MKKILMLLIAILLNSTVIAQEVKQFPMSWEGDYVGKLEIYGVNAVKMTIDMELKIHQKTDSIYQWAIIYKMKDREPNVRDYELKVVDTQKGHYQIDEKNSIVIDAFLKNQVFTSFFKVTDSYIVATYTQTDTDTIEFEIISATDKNQTKTGNTSVDGEVIPEVITKFVNGRQKAILTKMKPIIAK